MSEKIKWREAVEQDTWQDKEYGKLAITLDHLENEFGFDSKVAHDIYKERLWNPVDGKKILTRWCQFLSTIQENEGDGLLISTTPTQGFTGYAPLALIPSISLENVKYERGKEVNPSKIKVSYHDESTKACLAFAKNGNVSIAKSASDFVIPVASSDNKLIIDITDERIEFASFAGYKGLLDIADAQPTLKDYRCLRSLAKSTYY